MCVKQDALKDTTRAVLVLAILTGLQYKHPQDDVQRIHLFVMQDKRSRVLT